MIRYLTLVPVSITLLNNKGKLMGKVKDYFLAAEGALFTSKEKKDAEDFANMTGEEMVQVVKQERLDSLWDRHLKTLSEMGGYITKNTKYRNMVKEVLKELEEMKVESPALKKLKHFVDTEFSSESK